MTSESSPEEALLAELQASRAAGRYQELLAKAELAMALFEALNDATLKDWIIMVVADYGAVAARQLRDRERLRYFTDKIMAAGRRLGGSALAHGLGWRALAHELDGSLAAAAADYAKALTILRDVKDPVPHIEQTVRINYAELLFTRGEHESARAVVSVGGSPSALADVIPPQSGRAYEHTLATMANDIDRLTRLKLDALALGDKLSAGVSASNIGTALFDDGQPAAAIPHLVEARDLLRAAKADEHLAVTCLNLGLAHAALQGPEAIDCLKDAWAVIRVVAPRSPKALRVLYALARQRFLKSDFARAKAALDRGIGIYESVRSEIAVVEAEHEDTLRIYRLMLELRIILAMEDRWIDQAVDLIERGKARLWSEFLAVRAVAGSGTALKSDRSSKAALITGPKSVMLNYFVGPHVTFVAYNRPGRPGVRRIDIPEKYVRELVTQVTSKMLLWQSRSGRPTLFTPCLGWCSWRSWTFPELKLSLSFPTAHCGTFRSTRYRSRGVPTAWERPSRSSWRLHFGCLPRYSAGRRHPSGHRSGGWSRSAILQPDRGMNQFRVRVGRSKCCEPSYPPRYRWSGRTRTDTNC